MITNFYLNYFRRESTESAQLKQLLPRDNQLARLLKQNFWKPRIIVLINLSSSQWLMIKNLNIMIFNGYIKCLQIKSNHHKVLSNALKEQWQLKQKTLFFFVPLPAKLYLFQIFILSPSLLLPKMYLYPSILLHICKIQMCKRHRKETLRVDKKSAAWRPMKFYPRIAFVNGSDFSGI